MKDQSEISKLSRLFGSVKIKTMSGLVALLLAFVSIAVAVESIVVLRHISQVESTWKEFDQNASAKSVLLSDLRDGLGYGGTIHEFKNYVLRKDTPRIIRIHASLRRLEMGLMDYSMLELSEREQLALLVIDSTLQKYIEAVTIAEKMAYDGASSQQIDRAIYVDTSLTVIALSDLAAEVQFARQQSRGEVYQSVEDIETIAIRMSAFVGISLGVLIWSFLWFTRARLVGPIERLSGAMQVLANDIVDVKIPSFSRDDEISAMAKSVEVFRENTIRRLRAEREREESFAAQKIAIETTRASEEKLKGILDIAAEAVISIDEDSCIQIFNNGAENIFGYRSEEVLGKSLHMLLPEEYRGRHDDHVSMFSRSGKRNALMSERSAIFGLRKDGSTFPAEGSISRLEQDGNLIFTVILRDISAELAAEKKLSASQARLMGILDAVRDAILVVDLEGTIHSLNPAAEKMFGWSEEEGRGNPVELLLHQVALKDLQRQFSIYQSDSDQSTIFDSIVESTGVRRDTELFPVNLAIGPFEIDGKPFFTAVIRDMTDEKEVQNSLIEAKNQAEKANLTKSEFLANMSHEIRTPLNGVLGMANALTYDDLTEGQLNKVQIILESGDMLLGLLNDILDLSKVEAGRLELESVDFDLGELIDGTAALWKPRFLSSQITFTTNCETSRCLRGDVSRLRQILNNLISNAQKFTDVGSVHLDVQHQTFDSGMVELRFEVKDTGIGIAEDKIEDLFADFSQADSSITRKYGGTGLGLAICHRFVELMDGTMGVESVPGVGSTFWFTVQCLSGHRADTAAERAAHDDEQQAIENRKYQILVVEDNLVNQTVIRAILESANYSCYIVGNGKEAVQAVMDNRYDIVLMDIEMPKLGGGEAAGKIRKLPGTISNVPIIALTANAMQGDKEKYLALGMNGYVAKPIIPSDLFSELDRLLVPKLQVV